MKIVKSVLKPFNSTGFVEKTLRPPAKVDVSKWDQRYVEGLIKAGFLGKENQKASMTDLNIQENEIVGEKVGTLGEGATDKESVNSIDEELSESDESPQHHNSAQGEPQELAAAVDVAEDQTPDEDESLESALDLTETSEVTEPTEAPKLPTLLEDKVLIESTDDLKIMKEVIDRHNLDIKKNLSAVNMKAAILAA